MEWIVTQGECLFAEARAPFEKGRFTISVDYKEASCQRLYFNPTDTTWGSKMVERMSFKIFEDNNKVGHIVGKTQKTGFLKVLLIALKAPLSRQLFAINGSFFMMLFNFQSSMLSPSFLASA